MNQIVKKPFTDRKKFTIGILCLVMMGLFAVTSCDKPKPPPVNNGEDTITQRYYYAYDEKIYLDVVENTVVLSFDENYLSDIQQHLQGESQILHMDYKSTKSFSIYILTTTENANTIALMKDLKEQAGVKSVNPVYVLADYIGDEMYVTDEIVVKFKENVSQQEIDKMQQKYRLGIIDITRLFQVFSVPVDIDPLEVANAIQISGLVIYSHPNFISKINSDP